MVCGPTKSQAVKRALAAKKKGDVNAIVWVDWQRASHEGVCFYLTSTGVVLAARVPAKYVCVESVREASAKGEPLMRKKRKDADSVGMLGK